MSAGEKKRAARGGVLSWQSHFCRTGRSGGADVQALGRDRAVTTQTTLVANHLPIERVHHSVNDGVAVSAGSLDEDVVALVVQVDGHRLLVRLCTALLDTEPHARADDFVEVSLGPIQLVECVLPHCWSHFDVVTTH